MAWGSAIGAIASLGGGLLSSNSARKMQIKQEAYTERQMKNAHQWEVEDLQKAGLNPVLSANSAHAVGGASGQATQYDIAGGMQAGANAENAESGVKLNEKLGDQAESQALLNTAKTKAIPTQLKNDTITAKATLQMAEARTKEVETNVDRVKKLLPGEMQGQVYELAQKAFENQLTAREKAVLENTGLTLSEWKALGGEIVGVAKEGLRLKMAGETAKKIAEIKKPLPKIKKAK